MYKAIDREHGLDEFDEEEKLIDPLITGGFFLTFFSIVGVSLGYLLKSLFF